MAAVAGRRAGDADRPPVARVRRRRGLPDRAEDHLRARDGRPAGRRPVPRGGRPLSRREGHAGGVVRPEPGRVEADRVDGRWSAAVLRGRAAPEGQGDEPPVGRHRGDPDRSRRADPAVVPPVFVARRRGRLARARRPHSIDEILKSEDPKIRCQKRELLGPDFFGSGLESPRRTGYCICFAIDPQSARGLCLCNLTNSRAMES
mmetsp:Transcript_774/g.1741  ORF Transcript_774/g.1741 Transcript_774/m.1741 type:complete len:204 (+) Transcript_774:1487-2098(+)